MNTTCTLAIIATLAGGTILDSATENPMRSDDLPATIAAEPGLTTFTKLVKAAGLEATLHRGGPYTTLFRSVCSTASEDHRASLPVAWPSCRDVVMKDPALVAAIL